MLQNGKMIQCYQVLQHLGKLKINIVLSYSKGHGMQRFKWRGARPHTEERSQDQSDIPPQSAAAVVRIAARQRARLHHISKSNSSKIILTISKTLKQLLFLQLHRLNTYFLKHIHHQIFNSSTQSGMPNAEYKMTGNVQHVLSHCFQYQLRAMRETIPSLRQCFIISQLAVARILPWTCRVFSTWPCLTAPAGRVEMQSILQDM